MKPTFLKLHRWIGLATGLLLAVQALTGVALVFRDELERVVHPSLIVQEQSAALPVQQLLDAVRAVHPDAKLSRAEFPKDADQAVIVKWSAKGGRWLTAVDPYTGAIVRDGEQYDWPMEWIFTLHDALLAGPVGETIVGIEGLVLIFLSVSGLIYWWPGRKRFRQGFRVKLDGSADLRWRTLHRAVGAGVSMLLLVSAVTGVLMIWKDPFRDVLGAVVKVERKPSPTVPEVDGAVMVPVDRMIGAARAAYESAPLRQLRFSSGERLVAVYLDSGSRSARPDGTTQIYYNAYDGSELARYVAGDLPASSEFIDWLYPVHIGLWGGLPGKLLLVLTGTALLGMTLSGLWLWYSRTAKRRRTKSDRKTSMKAVNS